MQTVTIEAGKEIAEVVGLYNGIIAGLVAILHGQQMADGRGIADMFSKQAADPELSSIAASVARTMSSSIHKSIDELERVGAPPFKPDLRLVRDDD